MEALQWLCIAGLGLFLFFALIPLLIGRDYGTEAGIDAMKESTGITILEDRKKEWDRMPYKNENEIEHAYRIGKISRDERDRYIRTIR